MVALLAAIMLIVIGSWWRASELQTDPDHNKLDQSATSSDTVSELEPGKVFPNQTPRNVAPAPALPLREGLTVDAVHARIVDELGNGVQGATITWTPLLPIELGPVREWGGIDWAAIDAATLMTVSDARGNYVFSSAPADAEVHGSVLWFTHPDFAADMVLLDARSNAARELGTNTLHRTRATIVHVVSDTADPVAEARVEQVSLFPGPDEPLDQRTVRAHRLFHRQWTTDSDGIIRLDRTAGLQGWYATKGATRSRPFFSDGASPADVVLQLVQCFELTGSVRVAGGTTDGTPVRVRVDLGESARSGLDQLAVGPDLRFGPRRIPVVPDARYIFRLDGGGLLGAELARVAPAPGEQVRVDFESSRGGSVRVRVLGSVGECANASVVADYQVDGEWRSSRATTDDDGLALVSGLLPGSLWLDVSARRHATRRSGPWQVSADGSDPILEIELREAGVLRGTCLYQGNPIHDYWISYWGSDPRDVSSTYFRDRQDGTFEIEQAPLGEVHVVAYTDSLARSSIVQSLIAANVPAEVTLELPDSVRAVGTVVDAATSAPIASANAQIWIEYNSVGIATQGVPTPVQSDGHFELSNVAPGAVNIHIAAPGYASFTAATTAQAHTPLDLGVIALMKRAPIEVRLIGKPGVDYTGYSCELDGSEVYPAAECSHDGVARFPSVTPAIWRLFVYGPDEDAPWHELLIDLRPGKPWIVEIPFASDRKLEVQIRTSDGGPLPAPLAVECHVAELDGRSLRQIVNADAQGRAVLEHIAADEAVVSVWNNQANLAMASTLVHDGDNKVDVWLTQERQQIRVLDRQARPRTGVSVTLMDSRWRVSSKITVSSDANGIAAFPPRPFNDAVAVLAHERDGVQLDVGIDLSNASRQIVDVVFDPRATMRVQLKDGEQALPGLAVLISDASRSYVLAESATDAQGTASFGPVSVSDLLVDVIDARIWREQFVVRAAEDGHVSILQVRRLGGVELHVRNAAGLNVEGVEVALYCSELSSDVGAWLAEGRLGGATSPITDSGGKLRLTGLPRGKYRWTVGESATGEFDVVGGTVAQVDAVIP